MWADDEYEGKTEKLRRTESCSTSVAAKKFAFFDLGPDVDHQASPCFNDPSTHLVDPDARSSGRDRNAKRLTPE